MHRALGILRDEHRSILAVLNGMGYLVQRIRMLRKPVEPAVFHAMIYYLDAFCERMHHPKEDHYLFELLRDRCADAKHLLQELEEEHAHGEALLRRLAQALIRYEEGGEKEFPAFEREVENFARNYRDHMNKEENVLFPLAETALTDADWARINTGIARDRDPLAMGTDTGDYERLFGRILDIAPPPVGLGRQVER